MAKINGHGQGWVQIVQLTSAFQDNCPLNEASKHHSYHTVFILNKKKNIRLCTARAGNVIGGGDWSSYRLIPDCMKMWLSNKKPLIRNPNSTRPWQHVLEALSGYLILAIELTQNAEIYIFSKSSNVFDILSCDASKTSFSI